MLLRLVCQVCGNQPVLPEGKPRYLRSGETVTCPRCGATHLVKMEAVHGA